MARARLEGEGETLLRLFGNNPAQVSPAQLRSKATEIRRAGGSEEIISRLVAAATEIDGRASTAGWVPYAQMPAFYNPYGGY